MIENLIEQINLIDKELKDTASKRMQKERVEYLINKTKEISKDLDTAKCLRGLLKTRVDMIYDKSNTIYPRKRLNKVLEILKEEIN